MKIVIHLRGSQEAIPSEEASTLQIGSVAFPPGQYTSQKLQPYHGLFDQDGHQDSLPETIEEMKEAVTKAIDTLTQEDFHWGLPEVFGTIQQGHCNRRRLLRRGLEFHMCTINKSAHPKKVSKLI